MEETTIVRQSASTKGAHGIEREERTHYADSEVVEHPTARDKIAAAVHNAKDKIHPHKEEGEKGASIHHHTAADEAAVRHHAAEHPAAGAKVGAKLKQEAGVAAKEHAKRKLRSKVQGIFHPSKASEATRSTSSSTHSTSSAHHATCHHCNTEIQPITQIEPQSVVVCNDPSCKAPPSTTLQVACSDPNCTGPRQVSQVSTHTETDQKPLKEKVKELFHHDKKEEPAAKDADHDKSHEDIVESPTMKDKIAATVHNVKDKVHPYKGDGEKGASSHHHTAADEAAVRHHLEEHPGIGAKIGAKVKEEAAEAAKEHIKHKIRAKLGKEADPEKEKAKAEKEKAKAKAAKASAKGEHTHKEKATVSHSKTVSTEGIPASQVHVVEQAEPNIDAAIQSVQKLTGKTPAVNIIVMAQPEKPSTMETIKEAGVKAKELMVEGACAVVDATFVAKDKVEEMIAANAEKSKDGEGKGALADVKERALEGVHKVSEVAAVAKGKVSELIAAHKDDEVMRAPPEAAFEEKTIDRDLTHDRATNNPCTTVTAKAAEIVNHAKEIVVASVSKIPVVGPSLIKGPSADATGLEAPFSQVAISEAPILNHTPGVIVEDRQKNVMVRDVPLGYSLREEPPRAQLETDTVTIHGGEQNTVQAPEFVPLLEQELVVEHKPLPEMVPISGEAMTTILPDAGGSKDVVSSGIIAEADKRPVVSTLREFNELDRGEKLHNTQGDRRF